MATYQFTKVPVYGPVGGVVRRGAGNATGTVKKLDDTLATVVQDGVSQAGFLVNDGTGTITFTTTDIPTVVVDFGMGPLTMHADNLGDAAISAASNAAASAQSAADSAALVGAPAGSAIDAHLGGVSAGLVTSVNARSRLVAPSGTATQNTTTLQTAVTDAAAAGAPLLVRGSFSIDGQINVPANSDIDSSQARITQSANLTPVMVLNNVTGVTLRNLRTQGKTSDYENSSGVYAAAAVRLLGTTSDVEISGGSLLGMAGAGVFMQGGVSDVRIRGLKMTGAGSAYILNTTYNYSGGVVTDTGASKWVVSDCDISGFAQGVVTGDNMTDVRILHNYIHDIPGQHGLYIETVSGCLIEGNLVRNTALLGMKLQVGTLTSNDVDAAIINGNIFYNAGAQGILLDNPPGGSPRFRRVHITDNVVRTSAGHGIEVRNGVGVRIADNAVFGSSAAGLRIQSSSQIEAVDNRLMTSAFEGIVLTDVIDALVESNRVIDPGSANGASTEHGIHVLGSTSANLTFRGNNVSDSLGNMRYGLYVEAGDVTTMDFVDNRASGATDYGARFLAASAARSWRDNAFSGTLGTVLTPPTSAAGGQRGHEGFAGAAPTTGTWAVGDRVWSTAPAAGGSMGWVCTAAGTPGTWKTFGAISA